MSHAGRSLNEHHMAILYDTNENRQKRRRKSHKNKVKTGIKATFVENKAKDDRYENNIREKPRRKHEKSKIPSMCKGACLNA